MGDLPGSPGAASIFQKIPNILPLKCFAGKKKLEKNTGKDPRNQFKEQKRIQSEDPMFPFEKRKKNSPLKAP